jgi:hypothetical protein
VAVFKVVPGLAAPARQGSAPLMLG